MKTRHLFLLISLLAAGFLSGCGGSSSGSAFASATPEIKQAWDRAMVAAKANDYYAANTNLAFLSGQSISPEQLVAVQAAVNDINERMYSAAAKGDAAAQKAVESLKALQQQQMQNMPGMRR